MCVGQKSMFLHAFLYCSLPYFLRYCLSLNLEQLTDLTRLGWLVCKLNGFACWPSPAQLPVGSAEVLVPAHLVKEYWRESSQAVTKAVSGGTLCPEGVGTGRPLSGSPGQSAIELDGRTFWHLVAVDSPARQRVRLRFSWRSE